MVDEQGLPLLNICVSVHRFAQAMIVMLPISMTLAWLFSVAMTVRAIVLEKELRLREVMRMMGLSDGVLRLSWFITSLVVFTISVTAISAVLKVGLPLYSSACLEMFVHAWHIRGRVVSSPMPITCNKTDRKRWKLDE